MVAPTPSVSVTINDPSNQLSDLSARIISNVQYAWQLWAQYLNSTATIEVAVNVGATASGRAAAASASSGQVGTFNGLTLLEDSTPLKLATGRDVTGANPDLVITIDPTYARNELWFDPAPGTAPGIPSNRTDAVSVFTHELGHALGFTGFRNGTTGALAGNYLNTFDQFVGNTGSGLGFAGPTATAIYGGPVPLTNGNYGHYGNVSAPPGGDPLTGLMNGVAYYRGLRYGIGDLDLAILTDVGDPILVRRAGTDAADAITDNALPSEISAGQGNDTVFGVGGNDILYGNLGDDVLFGNQGSDVLYGNQGNDALYGGQGADSLFGGQNDDALFGNIGDDVMTGNLGIDVLFGGQGQDSLFGGQGDDVLSGDLGDDLLSGDLGTDTLIGGAGADRYVFGQNQGTDLIRDFNQADGDRLVLQGQTYTIGSAADGFALLTLSGGGTVELAGITAAQFSGTFVA